MAAAAQRNVFLTPNRTAGTAIDQLVSQVAHDELPMRRAIEELWLKNLFTSHP